MAILGALAALAMSAGAAPERGSADGTWRGGEGAAPAAEAPAPPWAWRGQVVEARQAAYRERLHVRGAARAGRAGCSRPAAGSRERFAQTRPQMIERDAKKLDRLDPADVMGDPGSGPVLRRHFEKLVGAR